MRTRTAARHWKEEGRRLPASRAAMDGGFRVGDLGELCGLMTRFICRAECVKG